MRRPCRPRVSAARRQPAPQERRPWLGCRRLVAARGLDAEPLRLARGAALPPVLHEAHAPAVLAPRSNPILASTSVTANDFPSRRLTVDVSTPCFSLLVTGLADRSGYPAHQLHRSPQFGAQRVLQVLLEDRYQRAVVPELVVS